MTAVHRRQKTMNGIFCVITHGLSISALDCNSEGLWSLFFNQQHRNWFCPCWSGSWCSGRVSKTEYSFTHVGTASLLLPWLLYYIFLLVLKVKNNNNLLLFQSPSPVLRLKMEVTYLSHATERGRQMSPFFGRSDLFKLSLLHQWEHIHVSVTGIEPHVPWSE